MGSSILSVSTKLHELLAPYAGQRYVGVVDGIDAVELVFSDDRGNLDRGNLLTLWLRTEEKNGENLVSYAHGFVADPEAYVARCGMDALLAELAEEVAT